MKLLLTSAGITNASIAQALVNLSGMPAGEAKIGFIPTAANTEAGNKGWYIQQLVDLKRYGFVWIDIVDISAAGVDWRGRLERVDIIVVGGGNTFHLLDQVRKTGFGTWLSENIATKVYVGISAGSIIVTPNISIASIDDGDVNEVGISDLVGLSLVNFEVSPHTPENVSHEGNKQYGATISNPLYAMDNQSAIQVVGDRTEVVSEGEWIKYWLF